jgi:hypothetical protein
MKKNSPKPKAKKKPSPNKPVKSTKATYKPGTSPETAALIAHVNDAAKKPVAKSSFMEDKRGNVRHEHTNHFTNRAPRSGK